MYVASSFVRRPAAIVEEARTQPDAIAVGPEFGPLLPPGEPKERGAPSHPIIEENPMTVQPPSVPQIVPRLDEKEPDIDREDDIPSGDNTSVDETSSSRDGSSGDIERE